FFFNTELKLIWSQVVIPKSIRECYRNNATFDSPLPLNLRIIVDIIQKMEKHSTTDMRIMSSSILHRFKFDGIEYQKNVQATDSILPFSGTGMQRTKHRLIEELVPGNLDALPMHVLSQAERCILHQAISNTIVRPDNEDKYKPCGQFIQTEKLTGKIVLTSTWNCPRQQGVILTPYGTVAPGSVIGAIAASLQHQNVAVNHLVAPQMIHKPSMWYQTLINSPVKLDNVWLTTIAGELAEMVVYQGPLLGNNMTLGATGFWQNTMQPTIYYLTSSYENFDATRSELIGGIDGMIIASYLQTWIQDFYSLRLSQILEMYYSYEGVTFNTNVKACDRAQTFLYAVPKTILNEQTYAIAQMLGYRNSIAYISPEALQRMVDVAIEKFYAYAENHLFPELPCQQQTDRPRIEALIVLDGAWSIDYTIDFLAVLVQDLDVSIYGSKMGIIHGTSGEWLLNVTDSPSLVFQALNNFTNSSWPTQLNYTQVLKTVSTHLNETWEYNRKHHTIGNLGQVVILLTPLGYMSNNDKQFVITLLRQIKNNHPVPRALRPAKFSNLNSSKTLTPQFEDYIKLSGYNELALIDHYKCTKASPCPNIYLSIQNVTSLYKCAEMDCKTPDQVRFIIRTSPQNSRYDNSAGKNVMLVSLNILVLFILHAFM
ncbi:hypothetical protein WH47_04066, partial [Habropoda laboriosa]